MSKDKQYHIPVLLNEVIKCLKIKDQGFYIDGTLGEGGHSYQIFKSLKNNGLLLSIDRDKEAIDHVKELFKIERHPNWILKYGNFTLIDKFVSEINRQPDGILLDLGLSSRQLEASGRGFSYQKRDEPLDMRMDTELNVTAQDLIFALSESELTRLFREFGEERHSKKIAKSMHQNRHNIDTVQD